MVASLEGPCSVRKSTLRRPAFRHRVPIPRVEAPSNKELSMDYRNTEDYARLMAAAEQRAHRLRREAIQAFWEDLVRRLRGAWHTLARS
jgi:hypothetical protein